MMKVVAKREFPGIPAALGLYS